MKKLKFILTIFIMFIIYIYVSYITLIPNTMFLLNDENLEFKKLPGIRFLETTMTLSDNYNTSNIEVKFLNNFSVKNIKIVKLEDIEVVPSGKIVGVKMYTNGVLIVGMSEIEDKNKVLMKPYENANIKPGDTILEIDEVIIENIEMLKNVINKSAGKEINLKLLRNGNILNTSIVPIETAEEKYQLGLWVKDAATGVGTMTFYEPKTKSFGMLGHGITDADTNNLINIDSGELVTAKMISLKKGVENIPGEIKGTILNSQTIGKISKNTQFGVYGTLNNLTALNIDTSNSMKVATRDEIKEGKAQILCSINFSNIPKEYEIEIEKKYIENDYNNKSMLIKITDEELLKETGGIIRGLSGAPIIQNGKFVGAVTNVLVSNPQIGYAVFGDIMIKEINILD